MDWYLAVLLGLMVLALVVGASQPKPEFGDHALARAFALALGLAALGVAIAFGAVVAFS